MTDLQKEYNRVRKNLLAKRRRLIKKGKKAPNVPKKPKKITQGSINRLNQISANISKGTGKIEVPKIKASKSQKAKKAAKTRAKNKAKKEQINYPTQTQHIADDLYDRLKFLTEIEVTGRNQRRFQDRLKRILSNIGDEQLERIEANAKQIEIAIEDIERYLGDSDKTNYEMATQSLIDIYSIVSGGMPTLDELKDIDNLADEISYNNEGVDEAQIIRKNEETTTMQYGNKQYVVDNETGEVLGEWAL